MYNIRTSDRCQRPARRVPIVFTFLQWISYWKAIIISAARLHRAKMRKTEEREKRTHTILISTCTLQNLVLALFSIVGYCFICCNFSWLSVAPIKSSSHSVQFFFSSRCSANVINGCIYVERRFSVHVILLLLYVASSSPLSSVRVAVHSQWRRCGASMHAPETIWWWAL